MIYDSLLSRALKPPALNISAAPSRWLHTPFRRRLRRTLSAQRGCFHLNDLKRYRHGSCLYKRHSLQALETVRGFAAALVYDVPGLARGWEPGAAASFGFSA
jgi:hypothetical protein